MILNINNLDEEPLEMNTQVARGQFTVKNKKGLHTRPSAELVKCALSFKSQITLECMGSTVDTKTLLGILTLGAKCGSVITVEAIGEDAKDALQAILRLAENEFQFHSYSIDP